MFSESTSTAATPLTGNTTASVSTNNNVSTTNHNTTTPSGRARTNSVANHHYNAVHMSKADEIEVQVVDQNHTDQPEEAKRTSLGWLCCAPCIWLRTSTTVHKLALSTATLLVTSLLVASPILFLISTAPSQLPRDCLEEDGCIHPTVSPPPECNSIECRSAASSIQSHMNWKIEPCKDFKAYSCAPVQGLRLVKSAQERAYNQLQQLLIHNTTTGPFRKLGRMFGSCLRQRVNSSTIKLFLDELGGYLPMGALGPSSIAGLVAKIKDLGPVPLLEIYFDLSYGKNPQIMLIIDGPNTSPHVLENSVRWLGPKAPPYIIREEVPNPSLLDEILNQFLPSKLEVDAKKSEKEVIIKFITELNQIRKYYILKDFSNSYVMNMSSLHATYPFLNWSDLISDKWTGPIVVRSMDYFNKLRALLNQYQTRVVHNSLLVMFALNTLPPSTSTPEVCTKATMWALPEITSALYIAQFTEHEMSEIISRTETIFDSLKAHLKRAPSLRGTALVKLSSLKMQAHPWPTLFNLTLLIQNLDTLEISSDNWFENVIKIYKLRKADIQLTYTEVYTAYAFPPISTPFYDSLSHSIVVPLSLMMVPYFDVKLPIYMHYATIGVALGREILRSITKSFDDKAMRCVPATVDVFSNSSRLEILIYSGGIQIAYHSLLSLTGPLKGVNRLPGLSLTPTQIFFLVVAQEMCIESEYIGIDTNLTDFSDILNWLIAQGGNANDAFHCLAGTPIRNRKTCTVL